MVRISIDPGIEYGYAIWLDSEWEKKDAIPVECGILKPAGADWLERVNSMARKTAMLFRTHLPIKELHMEYPAFFLPQGGHMVAARGDLVKLAYAAGTVGGIASAMGIKVVTHRVIDWKGQMTKDVVIKRIVARIPKVETLGPSSHAWDAIGIGLHAKGVRLCQ